MKHRTRWTAVIVAALLSLQIGCEQPGKDFSLDNLLPDLGRSSTAESSYETVNNNPQQDTERARKLNDEAFTLIQAGDYDAAHLILKQALDADIMFGPAHNTLGKVYFHQQRYYLAAWEFEYAAKLMPNAPSPRNNLGLVFESVGKLDQAIDAYDYAYNLEPANTQIIGNLTRARLRRGDRAPELKQLLELIIMKDTRPHWVAWANDRLRLKAYE